MCYPGVGKNGTDACDCNRYFGCHSGDCTESGGPATLFWLICGVFQLAILGYCLINSVYMALDLREVSEGTILYQTLLCNAVACITGFVFVLQLWIIRPLTCDGGTEIWSYVITDTALSMYVMFGVLMSA